VSSKALGRFVTGLRVYRRPGGARSSQVTKGMNLAGAVRSFAIFVYLPTVELSKCFGAFARVAVWGNRNPPCASNAARTTFFGLI
jgi:hypothetical protein